ncbi:MAG: trigger factor [Acidobacteria bacterium]|nr:trigger factor [Acidobacteriota bacterium]
MKLQVTITDVSQVKKDLAVEIPALEVKQELEKILDSYQRQAQLPGFRQGKAPREMIKARFKNEARSEAIQQLVPHALTHAIVDHNLRVVGEPALADVAIGDDNVLRFKATVEVIPEFELKDYKGLAVTKQLRVVEEKDVDAIIERFRETTAKFVDVMERAAQAGDFVTVDLVGKYLDPKEPHEEEGLKSDGVVIELNAEGVQAEFNEALTGVKAEDVKEFRVIYPEDFTSTGLAGKTLDFTATVKTLQAKEMAEVNDEFAKASGGAESVQEMRDKIRDNMVKMAEQEADAKLRENMVEKLLEDYDFAVPSVLVEQQSQDRLQQFAYRLMNNGMPPEYLNQIDWKERAAEARVFAMRDIRAALVIGRIGEAENLAVADEEVDYEIAAIAEEEGKSFSEVKASLTKDGGISSIESQLNYNKSLDWLVANAQVTVEELTSEQLAQANAPASVDSSTPSPEQANTATAE